MIFFPARLKGMSAYLPPRHMEATSLQSRTGGSAQTLSPAEFAAKAHRHTGVRTRRWALPQSTTSDLAAEAVRALEAFVPELKEAKSLIVGTSSPDQPSPATAHALHSRLQLPPRVCAFDVASSCSSFLSALKAGAGFAAAGESVLVVGAELKHKSLNLEDVRTASLFSDGAAAAFLEKSPTFFEGFDFSWAQSDSQYFDWIGVPHGGTRFPLTEGLRPVLGLSEPRRTYMHIVHSLTEALEALHEKRLKKAYELGIPVSKISGVTYVHQANGNILKDVAQRAPSGAPGVGVLMADVGNMVSASLPVARVRLKILELLWKHFRRENAALPATGGDLVRKCLPFFQAMPPSRPKLCKTSPFAIFPQPGSLICSGLVEGEHVVLSDAGATGLEDSWLCRLDTGELQHTWAVFEASLPRGATHRMDIWLAAGGGFQTLGCLHLQETGE